MSYVPAGPTRMKFLVLYLHQVFFLKKSIVLWYICGVSGSGSFFGNCNSSFCKPAKRTHLQSEKLSRRSRCQRWRGPRLLHISTPLCIFWSPNQPSQFNPTRLPFLITPFRHLFHPPSPTLYQSTQHNLCLRTARRI